MKDTPINHQIVSEEIKKMGFDHISQASIREIKRLVDNIEARTGKKYIRMEMGIPGLPPSPYGVAAEIKALQQGVAAIYPDIEGLPALKEEICLFAKNFINIKINPQGCIPTVGSMQGSFAAFMTMGRTNRKKDTTLFIDPGFPVHKQQHQVLGQKHCAFDVYNYRGNKLRDKLESYLAQGHIHSLLYSNPNNPSWICFTENELQIIGELATKYDVVVIEDLAYFGMDFRNDCSIPGAPPYQPSVAHYTSNYILLISSSKAFSYAGQRIGMMLISDALYNRTYPDLNRYYKSTQFGRAMILGTLYSLSSGTAHASQYGLAAMLKAANSGQYNFLSDVRVYGEKAVIMKKIFTQNGFNIVYNKDEDKPLADGFYFTIAYPGISGDDLLKKLIYYGISAISLAITGSERKEGLRACVSLIHPAQFPDLEYRLNKFHLHHAITN